MNTTKKRYSYDGAVRSFDDILSVKWRECRQRSARGKEGKKQSRLPVPQAHGAFSERSHPIDRENDGLLKGV